VRLAAARALGDLDDLAEAPAELIAALANGDPELRKAAAEALTNIPDPRALDALGRALSDPDREIRAAAVHALGHIEDERATGHLLRALKDPDREVRKLAAEALGERK
jgi:HEAT repeat protein